MMVKLLSQTDPVLGERMELRFIYTEKGVTKYKTRSVLPNLRVDQEWQKISADFFTPADISEARVNVRSSPGAEYLVCSASIHVIPADPDWRQTAQARIEQLRQNDICVQLCVDDQFDVTKLQLNVKQKTHDFPFGSAVRHAVMIDTSPDSVKYREVFFSNFNWAVIENKLKWPAMEWNQGVVRYPDQSIDLLRERGLAHWDVNNEHENGKWFEQTTGDALIMDWMFRQVHARAPGTALFLNDYGVLSGGLVLQSYVNTALGMIDRHVPLHGLGIQGHFSAPLNIQTILHRLDKVAEVGLPVWITELDITARDKLKLADCYDDVLTACFAHPAVEGAMLWGFSDAHHWRPQAALFEGPDYTPNAAGLRWQEMMRQRWSSSQTLTVSAHEQTFSLRGFYGTYDIQVVYNGSVIQTQEFHLKTGDTITVPVNVS